MMKTSKDNYDMRFSYHMLQYADSNNFMRIFKQILNLQIKLSGIKIKKKE